MAVFECEIAGLRSLLNKINFIKPCWVLNVEKSILKEVIVELEKNQVLKGLG